MELLAEDWLDGRDFVSCSMTCRLARHVIFSTRAGQMALEESMEALHRSGTEGRERCWWRFN